MAHCDEIQKLAPNCASWAKSDDCARWLCRVRTASSTRSGPSSGDCLIVTQRTGGGRGPELDVGRRCDLRVDWLLKPNLIALRRDKDRETSSQRRRRTSGIS